MKIAVVTIVFNGSFVLKQALDQIYPNVDQILVVEGPVSYWQSKGFTTSNDGTNEVLESFPDPLGKMTVFHGQFSEKTEQANACMYMVDEDIDYILCMDSDEVYKTADIIELKEFLEIVQPDSMAIRSCTFFGGFDHYLTGFEQLPNNFRRVFKYEQGAVWAEHRPPRLSCEIPFPLHIDGDQLFEATGIQMYHISYTFADQVYQKMQYYSESVNKNNIIKDYFAQVWLSWVTGTEGQRRSIERQHRGNHEFANRPDCYTAPFIGTLPEAIQRDMKELKATFDKQLKAYL